jgi:3-oxoacyl-[acyl-carrier-protein] synthase II
VARIVASALISCLGDGEQTFAGLLRGSCGFTPLRSRPPGPINVAYGAQVPDPARYAGELLTECVRRALVGLDLTGFRVAAIVGTGLRELAAVERDDLPDLEMLHFGDRLPGIDDVVTLANACSAGGHALALAQDMIECGEADVVVAAAADLMTTSMLAMIGRVVDAPTDRLRPFDRDRSGVLLGEGAGAVVVVADR